jgi:hypothetical protein
LPPIRPTNGHAAVLASGSWADRLVNLHVASIDMAVADFTTDTTRAPNPRQRMAATDIAAFGGTAVFVAAVAHIFRKLGCVARAARPQSSAGSG